MKNTYIENIVNTVSMVGKLSEFIKSTTTTY